MVPGPGQPGVAEFGDESVVAEQELYVAGGRLGPMDRAGIGEVEVTLDGVGERHGYLPAIVETEMNAATTGAGDLADVTVHDP